MKWVVSRKGSEIISPEFLKDKDFMAKSTNNWAQVNSRYFTDLDGTDELVGDDADDGADNSMKQNGHSRKNRHLWAEYFFDKKDYPLTHGNMSRYELFCSGWLHFYDVIVRGGSQDHEIYFKWNQIGKVQVYLYPGPKKVRSRLQPTSSPHMKLTADVGKAGQIPTGSSEFVISKDPPEPPPPPPPPM